MTDELNAPLGSKKKREKANNALKSVVARLRYLPFTGIAMGIIITIVGAAIVRIAIVNDPMGGQPIATVEISASKNTNPVAGDAAAPPSIAESPSFSNPGVSNENEPGGPSITNVDEALAESGGMSEATPAAVRELLQLGIDPELVEKTENGPIPHVGPNGKTPFTTYSRASMGPATANGRPLVAIVITGLGLSETSTLDAIERLPDNVTLAFAPYGRSLQRTTAAARQEGHEMLLQIPLEPFDYPENDPGPQTLLAEQPPRSNLDKLFWIMARFGGYYGVMNHMGARFTASTGDFEPIMEELGTRGLGYFDDGSSNRSVAPQLAQSNQVPFARASMELDASPSRATILAALQALEAKAMEDGYAIGVASALPISIQTIAEWANNLAEDGVILVPLSALMTKS